MIDRFSLKSKLRSSSRDPLIFGGVNVPSPELVELVGYVGYDGAMFDMEHGALGPETIQTMVRAADAAGIPALVRVPIDANDFVQRALDSGAAGIIFPHIEDAAQARAAYELTRHPPLGSRGIGYARAYRYSIDSRSTFREAANAGVIVGVQMESEKGLENALEILEVGGVDFGMIGRADLAVEMGLSDPNDPKIERMVLELGEIANKVGKPLGSGNLNMKAIASHRSSGYSIIYVGMMTVLANEAISIGKKIRETFDQR